MAPCGAWPSLAVLLSLFAALLPGSGGAQVSVHPLEAIVHKGGSVVVNCSATCNQSNIELGLETVFNKKLVSKGASWKVFELSDVQQDSSGLCYATCGDKPEQGTATTSITMYSFPERVELAPLPPWQPVGENFTLRCQVWGGAPRANLSVVLLRGQDELSRQLAVGEPAEVTATMPARREDYGANFSCRAELQLRGLELFKNSSTSRQLRTFERPHSVILEPPVLVGNEYMLRCQVTHVFPVGFLVVTLQRGGQVIYSESLKRFTNVNLANVTLSYRVPSQGRDLLQPVTCHARFNLNGMVVRSSSAPLMLTALAWSTEACLQPSAWSTESKALAFTSIAALVVILLAVGAAYLCKCL